jgi:hypothetical protein
MIDQLRAAAEALNQVTQNHLLLCSRQTQSGGAFPMDTCGGSGRLADTVPMRPVRS